MANSKPDLMQLNDLFDAAARDGVITQETSSLLTGHLGNIVVAGAAGMAMEEIMATDVTLITILIDASSSIAYANLEKAVRDGQNALLDAFAGSREVDDILVALWTFADEHKVLHSYIPVGDATRLDRKSYRAAGMTVLYDAWCDALAANVAYAQRLRDSGTPCRSVVVVITDGEDTGSKSKVHECTRISRDLLASEQFVLAFVGVGAEADFERVAESMGIPKGCVAVQKDATASALRQVFQMVSQSALRVSQGWVQPGAQAGFFQP